MPYEPQPDSLPAQVVGYFRLHPDEHLTLDDISTKFSAGRSNIHTLLARALDAEMLAREKSADGEWIYRAGKECRPVNQPVFAKVEPQGKPTPRKRTELDVDQLVICDDPIPASRASPINKYVPLFASMKVGQAIKCKPEEVARVGHAMRKWILENKLPYVYRLQSRYHTDGMARLWLLDAPAEKAEAPKLKKVA